MPKEVNTTILKSNWPAQASCKCASPVRARDLSLAQATDSHGARPSSNPLMWQLSHDATLLATASEKGTVCVWCTASAAQIFSVRLFLAAETTEMKLLTTSLSLSAGAASELPLVVWNTCCVSSDRILK